MSIPKDMKPVHCEKKAIPRKKDLYFPHNASCMRHRTLRRNILNIARNTAESDSKIINVISMRLLLMSLCNVLVYKFKV